MCRYLGMGIQFGAVPAAAASAGTSSSQQASRLWAPLLVLLCYCCARRSVRGAQIVDTGVLLQDLGLDALPDAAKINISQGEYTRMMSVYLDRLREVQDPYTIPELIVYDTDYLSWRRRRSTTRMRFTAPAPTEDDTDTDTVSSTSSAHVQSGELRLLAAPMPGRDLITVAVYQLLRPARRRLLLRTRVYVSRSASKWCEFDLGTNLVSGSERGNGYRLEVDCEDCAPTEQLIPLEATVTVLAQRRVEGHPPAQHRRRVPRALFRNSVYYGNRRRTECSRREGARNRCCLHRMEVQFSKLTDLPVKSIVQPRTYEAGFCRGRCPLNYNHATNHSRIQSLVHKLNKTAVPRVCCSPVKLEPLDILRINPADSSKLVVEKWDNMIVTECACA